MEEVTLVLLKPDCFERKLEDEITQFILQKLNPICLAQKDVVATEDQIFRFCKSIIQKRGNEVIPMIYQRYVGYPVRILVLKGESIIQRMRTLSGNSDPSKADQNSIRGIYGEDSFELARQESRIVKNLLTCSDSPEAVNEEFNIWFPEYKDINDLLGGKLNEV